MGYLIFQHGRLWIADLLTRYGHVELLCGEGHKPDMQSILLTERFLLDDEDHIAAIRRSVFRFPILWRPIRFAINDQERLGLQFKHRITGQQVGMYFADEHSSFTMKRTDVAVTEDEENRMEEHNVN